jgi:hypothetical protein
LAACIDKGLDLVKPQQETIRCHVETIQEVAATLDPAAEKSAQRQSDFDAILARLDGDGDPIHEHMAGLMQSFRAGLFAGDDTFNQIHDNLDLERWFRLPKGHDRRIHGHRHAGGADRPGRADTGARAGRPPHPPRTVRRRRPVAVPFGPRTCVPTSSDPPSQGDAEGSIQDETAKVTGRP